MKVCEILICMSCFAVVYSNKTSVVSNVRPSSANVESAWTLGGNLPLVTYNTTKIQVILSTNDTVCPKSDSFPTFHLGFYGDFWGNKPGAKFTLAIFAGVLDHLQHTNRSPVVVWSANGDNPVDIGANLALKSGGGLVLRSNLSGDYIWTANSDNPVNVKSMDLTCSGNLILIGDNDEIVWQSFDHPTDTWLSGQTLQFGQRLTSRVSKHNLETGKCYFSIGAESNAFVGTNLPVMYGNLSHRNHAGSNLSYFDVQTAFSTVDYGNNTYIRLDPNGELNKYGYNESDALGGGLYVLSSDRDESCNYPLTCGSYGICGSDHPCSCPDVYIEELNYFNPVDIMAPELGCQLVTEWTCDSLANNHHAFLELPNVTYFAFESYMVGISDIDSCKSACLEICSCRAALFRYTQDSPLGSCSLPTQLFTLMNKSTSYHYHYTAFIKVQRNKSSSLIPKLVPSISVGLLFTILCILAFYYVSMKKRKIKRKEEACSDILINTVAQFSFESLKLATINFQKRLGRGGFGTVYEGTIDNGTKVAVKHLKTLAQSRKEFLAEVNTIGNFHHYNLVKLIGFCDSGPNRLLVYEYMPNGSLDKWIFNDGLAPSLPWRLRHSIICGIAKGLEYLHENCLQNVIHFDIKPHNILLDADFNAKISDFGLAKMVDRDQSQVVTLIRGTPGYIAPELITAQVISVKLDVYSFGVLILEIVCGRKNVGSSSADLLINSVKIKAEEDKLEDLVDERAEDIQQHKEEAVKMLKVAMWCLQPHITRPSMSMVVKVLQDLTNFDTLNDINFGTMFNEAAPVENNQTFSTRPIESVLSGPR